MALPGRKSWSEELNIAQRYSDLSEPFFRVIKKHLESGDEKKEMWAVEQLSKAFTKMIPQDVTSGGQPLTISFDSAFKQ
jgi:hypothetical protein